MTKYLKSLVISAPLVASILISISTIHYTKPFLSIPITVFLFSVFAFILDYKYFSQSVEKKYILDEKSILFLKIYIAVIVCFCFLDLLLHGVVLFSNEEGKYMTFSNIEKRIRHISMLVWTFVPIAFFIKRWSYKWALIVFSLLNLVLFIDRGRIVLVFVTAIISVFLLVEFRKKYQLKLIFLGLAILGLSTFSILGKYRTGADDKNLIEASYLVEEVRPIGADCPLPSSIPFSKFYFDADVRIKWLLSYIAVPIYNLSTQKVCSVRDNNAVYKQLVPGWIRTYDVVYLVLVSRMFNVATEFLPFYLAYQEVGIFFALMIVYFSIYFAIRYCNKRKTIFSYLILVKLLSAAIFLNFAPLFFLWTNFGFIILLYTIDQLSTAKFVDKYIRFFVNQKKQASL